MEIRPVKYLERPKYPQKQEIDIEEVKKSIPKRWGSSPAAKIALGTLAIVSLAGCVPEVPVGSPNPSLMITEQTASPEDTLYAGVPMAPTVTVAPLFIHGEGRGAFGGDMASMPAFLSEDEALAVINEAASVYGLKFSSEGSPEFTNVIQPVTNIYKPEDKKPSDKTMTLKADFADSEHGIVIEFISIEDVKQWHQQTEYVSTLEQYETQDAAEQLSEGLEQAVASGGYYSAAVLYDPCDFSGSEAEARALSKDDIKAQAADFFKWLKDKGVI